MVQINFIFQADFNGLSNKRISFSETKNLAEPVFEIINMQNGQWISVGTFLPKRNLRSQFFPSATIYFPSMQTTALDSINQLRGEIITILTLEEPPFVQWVNESHLRHGQEIQRNEIEGYCFDLLDELQKALGFSYRLFYNPTNAFGSRDPTTGRWTGLVGELVDEVRLNVNAIYAMLFSNIQDGPKVF